MSPEEVAAAVEEIRQKVRRRHEKTVPEIEDFELPALDPLGHARDLAEGKAAAIGTVNPRPQGFLNNLVQQAKRYIARALNWLVREQIEFNRAAIAYMDRNLEAAAEQNHAILRLARELAESQQTAASWRLSTEEKLVGTEIRFLQVLRDIEHRNALVKKDLQDSIRRQHEAYLGSLRQNGEELQRRFWSDLENLQREHERQIHTELRLIRRGVASANAAPSGAASSPGSAATPGARGFDYARFEARFRGSEESVSANQEYYLPYFAGCRRVLDLGCGRGEFLGLLAAREVAAEGCELDPQALAACREKGLTVAQADLYEFLTGQPDASCDGVFCSHVVEHLPAARLQELADLVCRKLNPGGVFALETPNPACLAIFATFFYLDPTHQTPVPQDRLRFHLEEAGFGGIEVAERHPAAEVFPEIAAMDSIEELRAFRRRFFGGLDYAIIARKL